jgi:hypothetical protein
VLTLGSAQVSAADVAPEAAALACLGGSPALSTKLLRNLWLYCTLYELVPETGGRAYRWPAEWAAALTDIATVTPPMLLTSAHQVSCCV